jgi:GT2 family glycosyltransferase
MTPGAEGPDAPDPSCGRVDVAASVVLACRNAAPFLATQLRALSGQSWRQPWELIISDNGSTDRSREIAEEFRNRFPRMILVDSSATPGPGAARNAGVRVASADRILFCDADDQVGPNWLAAMAEALEEHGLVAARLDHSLLNRWPGLRPSADQPGLLQTRPPFSLPYVGSCALGVRRQVHETLGGFDESYRDAAEDRDYCYRAQLAGIPLVLVPDAVVHYRHRATPLAVFQQRRSYGRGHVQLYRDYRQLGMTRPSSWRQLARWGLLPIKLIPALTSRRRLTIWLSRLGWHVGRLEGSLRHRVWAP